MIAHIILCIFLFVTVINDYNDSGGPITLALGMFFFVFGLISLGWLLVYIILCFFVMLDQGESSDFVALVAILAMIIYSIVNFGISKFKSTDSPVIDTIAESSNYTGDIETRSIDEFEVEQTLLQNELTEAIKETEMIDEPKETGEETYYEEESTSKGLLLSVYDKVNDFSSIPLVNVFVGPILVAFVLMILRKIFED